MTFVRDPLSVEFDQQAKALLDKAVAQARRKQKNASVRGWVEALIPTPMEEFMNREDRPDRLSRYERAFQRALYYDQRIHRLTGGIQHPNSRWSLKCDWQPAPMAPGAPRRLRVTLFSDSSGSRHAERSGNSYVRNPELRSAGGIIA